jgi:hypothetical protein
LKRTDTGEHPTASELDFALGQLSTDGVTSENSRSADPERMPEYQEGARHWLKRYKETRKKSAAKKRKGKTKTDPASATGASTSATEWMPTVEEVERLLFILETNSHSRNELEGQDLHDPRLPPPLAGGANATPQDDFDDDSDEACGVWLVTSMCNHSCVPNAIAHIESSEDAGGPPPLHLRCIRPIAIGDEISISYHGEEFLPTEDRQSLVTSRGFKCTCPMCVGKTPDHARASRCANCIEGVVAPVAIDNAMVWICDLCNSRLTDEQVQAVIDAETTWLSQWPMLLEMMDRSKKSIFKLMQYRVLKAIASHAPSATLHPSAKSAILTVDLGCAPLHVCNGHLYTFLKWAVFEQSVWLRDQFGPDGIMGVLLTMCAIVDRVYRHEASASEESRTLGYWLAKEADLRLQDTRLSSEEIDRYSKLKDEGFARWELGMRVLYGKKVDA